MGAGLGLGSTGERSVFCALGTRYSVLGTRYSVLGTRYSVLGTRYSVLGTRYSVLGTRYSVLGTRYSVLGTGTYPQGNRGGPPTIKKQAPTSRALKILHEKSRIFEMRRIRFCKKNPPKKNFPPQQAVVARFARASLTATERRGGSILRDNKKRKSPPTIKPLGG